MDLFTIVLRMSVPFLNVVNTIKGAIMLKCLQKFKVIFLQIKSLQIALDRLKYEGNSPITFEASIPDYYENIGGHILWNIWLCWFCYYLYPIPHVLLLISLDFSSATFWLSLFFLLYRGIEVSSKLDKKKLLTFIRKIFIKSYPFYSISKQFTSRNFFLKS